VRVEKTAENSLDYSLHNTLRQALFLPTSRESKYKAKAAIDTFAVRAGDTFSAIVIWIGVRQIGVHGRGLAAVSLVLVVAWLLIAGGIVRYHRRRSLVHKASRAAGS